MRAASTPAQRTGLPSATAAVCFLTVPAPLAWCEGHHLASWVDGGPTDLPNLALVCRAHHRAVHEGGWQLTRDPDRGITAIAPSRGARRHPGHHPRQPAMVSPASGSGATTDDPGGDQPNATP